MRNMTRNAIDPKLSCETEQLELQPEYHECYEKGIIIQRTSAEKDWNNVDDEKLVFTMDEEKQKMQTDKDEEWSLQSPMFHVPLSPSSPGSLGPCSSSSTDFLSPSSLRLGSLVKSLSTELELKYRLSLKPRPLLNLVKPISTELSRSNPDLSQSKSDSNLNLWMQLTQFKGHNGSSCTASPSPVNLSPSEPKAGLFKVDTCQKLSKAMQEPLNVFSKIMCEDCMGSPKQPKTTGSMDSHGKGCGKSSGDPPVIQSPMRTSRREERHGLPTGTLAVRHCRKCHHTSYCNHLSKTGDAEQTEKSLHKESVDTTNKTTEKAFSPVSGMVLCCVAALSYCYLILPLSSFWSGMFVGLAFGFMLGLLLIHLGSTRKPYTSRLYKLGNTNDWNQSETSGHTLQSWLNEMYTYDPETYQPSLMHSVYATLDGPCLRLDYPSINIPHWASFSEPNHDQNFKHSRMFHLDGSKVFLLPVALARKRLWNRKYPICITLAHGEGFVKERLNSSDKPTFISDNPGPKTNHTTMLYLFGRTGREKEEWFNHLLLASMHKKEDVSETSDTSVPQEMSSTCLMHVTGSTENISSGDMVGRVRENFMLEYTSYMTNLISSTCCHQPSNSCHYSTPDSPTETDQTVCCHGKEMQPFWVNAFIGRLFWDFLREKSWADQVASKIQKKLSKIRLPYFMDELTLTELSMGSCMPQISDTFLPHVNTRGLWLHLGIEYKGALQMTLETKINLSKLVKYEPEAEAFYRFEIVIDEACQEKIQPFFENTRSKLALLADSDEESSSAGSSDEDEAPSAESQRNVGEKGIFPGTDRYLTRVSPLPLYNCAAGGSAGRRILRLVDKIAKSKCIQKATENQYIKKKIEEMSSMPLLLTVEVKELSGTLAVNIPPSPTDRLWYGFCVPPKLELCVRLKLGQCELTFCQVTEWIEKKLQDEFKKVFVLPNMDDIYLPLMRCH